MCVSVLVPSNWPGLVEGEAALALSGNAGVVLFNTFLRRVALQKLFLGLALAGVGARLTQLLLVTGGHTGLWPPFLGHQQPR